MTPEAGAGVGLRIRLLRRQSRESESTGQSSQAVASASKIFDPGRAAAIGGPGLLAGRLPGLATRPVRRRWMPSSQSFTCRKQLARLGRPSASNWHVGGPACWGPASRAYRRTASRSGADRLHRDPKRLRRPEPEPALAAAGLDRDGGGRNGRIRHRRGRAQCPAPPPARPPGCRRDTCRCALCAGAFPGRAGSPAPAPGSEGRPGPGEARRCALRTVRIANCAYCVLCVLRAVR